MIKNIYFTEKKIREISNKFKVDPLLLERLIFGIELLGNLAEEKLNLIFKGGTSVLLVVPEIKRLSIDIDIIVHRKYDTLKEFFDKIIAKKTFKSWEEDIRRSEKGIPKEHYKIYYDSPVSKKQLYVLLDIIKMDSPYTKTLKRSLNLPFWELEKNCEVLIPDINSLISDKLSAFAPNTIGIKFEESKSMEIIKQLFDIGILFEYVNDLKTVKETYKRIAEIESQFRKIKCDYKKFLQDSIDTAFLISQLDFKGSIEDESTRELREGINKIKSYVVGGKYSLLNAKEDAAKLACLAFLTICDRETADLAKIKRERTDLDKIKKITLTGKYSILNKLKNILPESFYLWAYIGGSI